MKKNLLTALAYMTIGVSLAQTPFFVPTTYRGAFAPAPTSMWTDTWTEWDPQNKVYPAPTVTVTGNILGNTTWFTGQTVLLSAQCFVKNNSILTIQPGVTILGDKAVTGAGLFITKGSQLIANGTVNQPIVFTSNQAPGARNLGDWGGVILLGQASNNNAGGINNIEGLTISSDTEYGGGTSPNDNDNSGSLSYVRIEFGGYIYQPGKEINGLTFGAVGRGTTIDFVQVSFANDDAFEWFGGTVNCKHLVAYRNLDDDFDTDNGFSGNVQFCLGVKDPQIADNPTAPVGASTSEGFESDNDASGTTASPLTGAIFSNVTDIGPLRGSLTATVAVGHRRGARLRRNTNLKIYNTILMDHATRGVFIDGSLCEGNANSGALKFKNNILAGYKQRATETGTFAVISPSANAWLVNPSQGNDTLLSSANILVNPYNYTSPDYRPVSSGVAATGASFTDLCPIASVTTATVAPICANQTLNLQATATGTGTITYNWIGLGTIASANSATTSVTGASGNYTVNATNACGTASAVVNVVINALPNVTIGTFSAVCLSNSNITLTNGLPTGGSYSGTGVASGVFSPATAGVGAQTITYSYTDGNGCSNTASNNITVNALPNVTIGTFSAVCLSNSNITLTNGLPTGGSYSGNGVTSGVFSPATAGAGAQTITYSYTDGNGCSNTASNNITVNALPNVTIGTFSAVCSSNSNITLANGLPTGGSYSGTGVTSGVFSPATAGAGTYTITYSFTDGNGCSNTASNNITVNATPVLSIISSTICAGATGTVSASGANTYTWNTGATTNSIIDNPAATTVYTVNGTSAAGCLGSSVSATITVGAAPSIVVNSASICAGSSATLTANGVSTYTWNTGANSASIVVTPTVNTVYSVNGDLLGCGVTASNSATVTINALPVITVNSGTICAGQSFTMVPSGATTYTYSSGSNVVSPVSGQSYTVTGTNVNGCVSASGAISTIAVNNLPTVTIGTFSPICLADASFTLTNGLPSGGSYSGNGVTGGVFSPATAGVGSQAITYSFTDGNGCSNTASNNILVNTCTGINQNINEATATSLFPNPASNKTMLVINANMTSKINVAIYDFTGKLVLNALTNENVTEGKNEFNINTENLSNGIYLLNILTDSSKETIKLIINN